MKKTLIVFIIAVFIGFGAGVHFNYVRNPSSVQSRLQELVLFTNDSCYHIHHSMVFTLCIACIAFGRLIKNTKIAAGVVGLMVGASLMDLLYPDWDLVKDNCHRSKIMQYFKRHPSHSYTSVSSGVS